MFLFVVGVVLGALLMPLLLEGLIKAIRFIGEPDYFIRKKQ